MNLASECRKPTAAAELQSIPPTIAVKSPSSSSSNPRPTSALTLSHLFLLLLSALIPPAATLTSEERGELARKFKYYHKSVRPSVQFNMVETVNGTFFRLLTQLELLETREMEMKAQLNLELVLFVHFRDDRLQLRDLPELPIPIPEEFLSWQPRLMLFPLGMTRGVQMQRSTNLSPRNGQLTVVHRFSGQIGCEFDAWKVPFQRYRCEFWFETDPDERLHLTVVRDLRPNGQMRRVGFGYEQWPWLQLNFDFQSGHWQLALVSAYLPSLLLFGCALLAQWKRRKIQVLVSLGAILALILIQYRQQQQQPLGASDSFSSSGSAVSLLDLWLAGVFCHLVCLLSADLVLPARRLLVFKRAAPTHQQQQQQRWISEDERRLLLLGRSGGGGGEYSSPLLNFREQRGEAARVGCENGSPTGRKATANLGTEPRYLRAAYFPSSSSSLHHYVSSPRLGHRAIPSPVPRQQRQARLPAAPTSPAAAKMIRTFSVPPRRLDDVRRALEGQQGQRQQQQPSIAGPSSAPISRKRSQQQLTATTATATPFEEAMVETVGDERQRAIASLLSEMESIRRAETAAAGGPSPFRRGSSEEEDLLLMAGHVVGAESRPPPPPPPPGRFQLLGSRPPLPTAFSRNGSSNGGELGRIQGQGVPRRKRLALYAICGSFCLFLASYVMLVAGALLDWL